MGMKRNVVKESLGLLMKALSLGKIFGSQVNCGILIIEKNMSKLLA
jgi:hypothetical protein